MDTHGYQESRVIPLVFRLDARTCVVSQQGKPDLAGCA